MSRTNDLLAEAISEHFDKFDLSDRIAKALDAVERDAVRRDQLDSERLPRAKLGADKDVPSSKSGYAKLRALVELAYWRGQENPTLNASYLVGWMDITNLLDSIGEKLCERAIDDAKVRWLIDEIRSDAHNQGYYKRNFSADWHEQISEEIRDKINQLISAIGLEDES